MEPDHATTTNSAGQNDRNLSEQSKQFVDFFVSPTTIPDGDYALVEGNNFEDSFFKAIFKPSNFAEYNGRENEEVIETVNMGVWNRDGPHEDENSVSSFSEFLDIDMLNDAFECGAVPGLRSHQEHNKETAVKCQAWSENFPVKSIESSATIFNSVEETNEKRVSCPSTTSCEYCDNIANPVNMPSIRPEVSEDYRMFHRGEDYSLFISDLNMPRSVNAEDNFRTNMNQNDSFKLPRRFECLPYQNEACRDIYLEMSKKQPVAKSESVYKSDDSQAVGKNLTVRVDNASNKCETIRKERQPQIEQTQIPQTQNDRWEKQFSELKAFKKEQGHCKVPGTYKNIALYRWVLHQRYRSRQMEREGGEILTIQKKERLDNIGFEWDSRTNSDKLRWDEQFCELQNFKKEWGHCNVPTNYAKKKSLARWVVHQRALFRRTERGEKSNLTTENRKRLESIGFQLVFGREESENLRWNKHFCTLQDFKQEWGHFNVPTTHAKCKQLSAWVQKQRHLFKCSKRGDKACFVVERKKKLESIGFQ